MAKVYFESAKKWAIGAGIPAGIAGFALIFYYLIYLQAVTITGFSQDQICAGTSMDPCIAMINLTANEDTFLYPLGYDPYGRNTPFETDKELKSWKMFRSWGSGWREINLNKTCTATWCGAPPNSPDNKYSFAFRKGNNYTIKIEALKKNPSEDVKWGFGSKEIGIQSGESFVDPVFLGLNGKNIFPRLIENKADLDHGEAIFEFNNPYNNLDLKRYFNFNFVRLSGNEIDDFQIYINISQLYQIPETYGEPINKSTTCRRVEAGVESFYPCIIPMDNVTSYRNEYREEWRPANETISRGSYKIRMVAYWKPELGQRSIDWQPSVVYPKNIIGFDRDLIVEKPEWAWFNSSWAKKRQLNFTLAEGRDGKSTIWVEVINLSSSNFSGAQADGDDFRFVNSTEDGVLNSSLQNKSNGNWWKVRIENNNESSIWIYYNNPTASSVWNWNNVYSGGTNSLVAGYALDESSGNLSEIFNMINLTANGTPNYGREGKVNTAVGFDSNNDYFYNSNATQVSPLNFGNFTNFSISCFMYNQQTLLDRIIMSTNDYIGSGQGYYIVTDYNGTAGFEGGIGFYLFRAGGSFETEEIGKGLVYNKFQHLVFTRRKFIGAGGIDILEIFLNTTLSESSDHSAVNVTAVDFTLGDEDSGQVWNGTIDDCFIFNKTISGTPSIRNLYYTTSGNFTLGSETSIYPLVNMIYPENATYNFADSPTTINYTRSSAPPFPLRSCWYSKNGGITNSSLDNTCSNFTGLNASVGINNWTVYVNNSAGWENSSRIFFTVDYFNISITPLTQLYFFPNATLVNATNAFNQTSSRGVFTMNNNLGRNINISAKLNQTVANITLKLGNTSSYSNSIIINTTFKLIYNNFTAGNTTQLWAWADYNGSASIWFPQLEITNSS